jgi:hypothetical protein
MRGSAPLVCVAILLMLGCTTAETQTGKQTSSTDAPKAGQGDITPGEAAKIPPFPPTDVKFAVGPKGGLITWESSSLESVTAYRVYRRIGDTKQFEKIAEVRTPTLVVDKKDMRSAHDYAVTAVSAYGAESSAATPVPTKAPDPNPKNGSTSAGKP